jgi:hypothetical protein
VFVLNTNQKGAIAEAAITAEATKLGVVVSRPNVDARYDLIFDVGARLLRVQYKSAVRKGDVVAVPTQSRWYSPGRGYVRTPYASNEIDAVAAYCGEIDATFLLPISLVAGQSQVHRRLAAARNGQLAGLHSASEYELGAIAQLGERRHGMAEAVGSSPTSSTSEPESQGAAEIGAYDFRNRFGWYAQRAAAGQEFLVRRRGKPYVRLGPVAPPLPLADLGD